VGGEGWLPDKKKKKKKRKKGKKKKKKKKKTKTPGPPQAERRAEKRKGELWVGKSQPFESERSLLITRGKRPAGLFTGREKKERFWKKRDKVMGSEGGRILVKKAKERPIVGF